MIVIVDYGMGNLGSIANMLKKLGAQAIVSSDPDVVADADKLILPGVGAFDNGMRGLAERGLIPALNDKVLRQKTPVLGVCLGMQLVGHGSEEGILPGLGWIDAKAVHFRFAPSDSANGTAASPALKVPHMGWNYLHVKRTSPLLMELNDESRFYFVHSYHVVCCNSEDVLATCDYGVEVAAIIGHGHVFGTQFHPEKSHRFGMRLLRNFVELI